MLQRLNNVLVYADSTSGLQYSENRGNRDDLSHLKINPQNSHPLHYFLIDKFILVLGLQLHSPMETTISKPKHLPRLD